ncbi:hypothetical protein EHW67_01405 [Arenibacter aquaticus]|uniref:Toxin-antitoxin system YwqK family antitoxin n=1 Tax=Arenibacter aquaticus TaxID=2489054 RepID=A0A3S0C9P2_9FLAO|nr:hypothetical protein [Arenibacter aquaticus]RTE55250.1 hypothetical protein EHW67_01405 [Arenibacter aquaticus]
MRALLLLLVTALLLLNCKEATAVKREVKKAIVIDSVEVPKQDLILNQNEGKWYYKNQPYNGYSVKFHSNGTLAERLGFLNGKREGVARRWSEKGVLRIESTYHQNKLVGVYRSWWENGVLAEESHYVKGLKDGEEKQWYATGQLSKVRQLVAGKEEGLQKAWLPNGKLYVNYEAKNGRIFGMLRANSCYKLEDEVVIRS